MAECGNKKRVMMPMEAVDLSAVEYTPAKYQAPRLRGFLLKLGVWAIESYVFGPILTSVARNQTRMTQLVRNTFTPEKPMYLPEFPPQEPEEGVVIVDEERDPIERLESTTHCLPSYDPSSRWGESRPPFLYWKIRDYAHAYRSNITTPSLVAERLIAEIEEWDTTNPMMRMLIHFSSDDVRKQSEASTSRFSQGNALSVLDGIFMAIKDDIDCYPYPSRGGTTWFDQVRTVSKDAVCVARLRRCGVILIGKANMQELGLGTTGNNPNYGTPRNPHARDRYTGGSSSGPATLVASGLCPAAIGTDGGGSIRIPASLCGIVGLKTTYGRVAMTGSLPENVTVAVISPLATSVEDAIIVYSALAGSTPSDKISLRPSPLCVPDLSSSDYLNILQSVRIGKYSEWFHDVLNTEISTKCEDALTLLCETFGCQVEEIVLPELEEMGVAHMMLIGCESLSHLGPDYSNGRKSDITFDSRSCLAVFSSFSASDYVACQRLRRRQMYYHMEAFKKVDIIVTPTTGITAPKISPSSLKVGESDYSVSGYLMKFVQSPNLLGLPAISVPIGHDKDGLPIGLQLIGRPWSEATLLRAAFALEELCIKSRNRPSAMFYDMLNSDTGSCQKRFGS